MARIAPAFPRAPSHISEAIFPRPITSSRPPGAGCGAFAFRDSSRAFKAFTTFS
jgi:hypothetical protein